MSLPKCGTLSCKNRVRGFKRCAKCRKKDRRRRAKLIKLGLCTRCEVRPASGGRLSCERCAEFDRVRNAKRREAHLRAGLCAQCGERPPRPGQKRCEKCGSAHKIAAAKGLCCRCKHEPATVGRFCLDCKKRHHLWEENQVKAGKCIRCDNQAVEGLIHCQKHRLRDRERTRERTKRLKAEGKCRICTEPSFGKSRCPACQKEHAEKSKRRREELNAKGLCDCCGKRPRMVEYKRCEECLKAKNDARRTRPEQIAARKARVNRRYQDRIAAGLCPKCGKRPPAPGVKACDGCREMQSASAALIKLRRTPQEPKIPKKAPLASQREARVYRVVFGK